MDCIVHGVAKSQTGLSGNFHFHFTSLSMITSAFLGDKGPFYLGEFISPIGPC